MDRVLEIGGIAAGYCGRLFAHAGADVVRVEFGDSPPAWASAQAMDLYLHSDKRRVVTDDIEQIAELANRSDVVVCDAPYADALDDLGFAAWTVPVKLAMTPFGLTGPKRNWRATPNVLLAMGGYTNLIGDPDKAPLTLPGHYLEFQTGAVGFTAVNACRLAAENQVVDVGMLETLMSLSQFTTVRWHCAGELRSRHGSDFYFVVPSNLFACQDGWVYVNIVPTFWDPLTVFLDRPELLVDERFTTNDLRMQHRDALHEITAEAIAGFTRAELAAKAEVCRIPLGVVQDFDEVLADPHLAARDFWQHLDVEGGQVQCPPVPFRINYADRPRRGPDREPVSSPVDGPLNGTRILDLTHVWAGPLAVRFLADLGARVVKVEAPYGRGPRQFPSEPIGGWLGGEPGDEPWNVNAIFNKLHRNRQSLCIDLKQAEGMAAMLALVAEADVVIENFSARAMPAMGLDYATLKQANPNIIYVTMPGFGTSGPYRDRVAFGPTVEPMSGLTAMLGYGPDEPRNSAMALMDPIAATHAAAAVLTALREREANGHGAYVELSLHEGGVAYSGPWLVDTQLGSAPQSMGNRHPRMAPHGVYRCRGEDQWLALACADDAQWHALCALIDELEPNLDFSHRAERSDQIDAHISRWLAGQEKTSAARQLQTAGVPAGAVNSAPDMLADPHVQARGFFVPYEQFDTPMPGNPIHMPGLDSAQWTRCPRLGADNAAVLSEWLNYDQTTIDDLAARGVIFDQPPA